MRHHLKSRKQLSFIQFLLLFPIIGLLDLKKDLRRNTIEEFTTGWIIYLLLVNFWCLAVGGMIYAAYMIYTNRGAELIPLAIMLGVAFLLLGIPRIIYKLANRKPRK